MIIVTTTDVIIFVAAVSVGPDNNIAIAINTDIPTAKHVYTFDGLVIWLVRIVTDPEHKNSFTVVGSGIVATAAPPARVSSHLSQANEAERAIRGAVE